MFAHGLVLLKVSQRQGQGEMRRVMFGPVMQSLLVGLDRIGISLRRKNQAEVVSGIGIRRRDRQTTQQLFRRARIVPGLHQRHAQVKQRVRKIRLAGQSAFEFRDRLVRLSVGQQQIGEIGMRRGCLRMQNERVAQRCLRLAGFAGTALQAGQREQGFERY